MLLMFFSPALRHVLPSSFETRTPERVAITKSPLDFTTPTTSVTFAVSTFFHVLSSSSLRYRPATVPAYHSFPAFSNECTLAERGVRVVLVTVLPGMRLPDFVFRTGAFSSLSRGIVPSRFQVPAPSRM